MSSILCYLHTSDEGGVERTAVRLCGSMVAAGEDVRLVVGRSEAGALPPFCDILPGPAWLVARIETLWMIVWLPWLIMRLRPDILFCAGNTYAIQAVIARLLLGSRCPPIVAKISNDVVRREMGSPLRQIYHWWCRLQGRYIDRLIALSPAMKQDVMTILQVPTERVLVIANPILDQDRVEALVAAGHRARASRGKGRRFVAIGRLARQKDFATLLSAFHGASRPGDRLTIAGTGPEETRLRAQIEQLDLGSRVWMIGHCEELDALLAASDILVLSSIYEGLPGVVIEAMTAGLAIIATDCCSSMADLLEHGRNGVLVPPSDAHALGEALATIDLPGSAAQVGDTGTYRVEEVSFAYVQCFATLLPATPPMRQPLRPLPLGSQG